MKTVFTERIMFGVIIIGGYFALGLLGSSIAKENPAGAALIHDMLLVIGPILGGIAQAVYKFGATEARAADTAAVLAAKSPDFTTLPTVLAAAAPSPETDPAQAQ